MKEKPLLTILIVDDEPRNRRLLDAFLSADGYTAIHANNGQEALMLSIDMQPSALLLDLMMPDMDGFQVLQKLKDNPATQAIPVIIVSALDDLAARQRVLASGADDFLGKPVDRWELSLRLHRLLHKGEVNASTGDTHDQ
ncbi:response regulator [Iodobacter fluviatilis]|uniref:Stalked cell differentiation-controlling protein n=1 Tax=Iodobacter fluviatilis TaxID=537 RepID=A0A377Q9E6_9NEIS|nr:response regulator [Iodobacter fluviatilis]TCU88740.1 two-component system cell cycle response regulator [Iodobacter fluviatilis]STQ91189.1 Stalked cell differentiation-controlling protein [Iodobacter fluviatilis]